MLTICRLQDYAREYIRLSLLGVNNINKLQECSMVLPQKPAFVKSPVYDKVVQGLQLGKLLDLVGGLLKTLLGLVLGGATVTLGSILDKLEYGTI